MSEHQASPGDVDTGSDVILAVETENRLLVLACFPLDNIQILFEEPETCSLRDWGGRGSSSAALVILQSELS